MVQENPDKTLPNSTLTKVDMHNQGVQKKPRILVVYEPQTRVTLAEFYEANQNMFHNCELIFADNTDPKKNAKMVLDAKNGIDGVVTGFSLTNPTGPSTAYGYDLAKLLQESGKPVIVTTLGDKVHGIFKDMKEEAEKKLTGDQRRIRDVGVLGVYDLFDLKAFEAVTAAVRERSKTMRAVE